MSRAASGDDAGRGRQEGSCRAARCDDAGRGRQEGSCRAARCDDAGSALVEFTVLSLLLLVPLVYLLLSAFQVQRAAFGVTEAARQAGRAFARAESVEAGTARAQAATRLALADQGLAGAPPPLVECLQAACLAAGSTVRVTVSYTVRLPVLSLLSRAGVGIPVTATHVAVVDTFQDGVG